MRLRHAITTIACPEVSTLLWDSDDLVDVTNGNTVHYDGSVTAGTQRRAYPFDRAIGLRQHDIFWTVAYANRQTKAILIENGEIHRELNRSFYFANAYDYPMALATTPNGRGVIVHCSESFDIVEVQDAQTGNSLARRKTPDMEFHSRLAV